MRIVVISADYPSPDYVYGDVFVHTRLKQYRLHAEIFVVGHNTNLSTNREFVYEEISAFITPQRDVFYSRIRDLNPDLVIGHFVHGTHVDFLLSLNKPLIVFIHGFEALSWKRRLMNYTTLGDLRYLWFYTRANKRQLAQMKKLALQSNNTTGTSVDFVFVSNWVKQAVQEDLGVKIKKAHVIPNGIDTNLFAYHRKEKEQRKKILLLRSFKARNYANDLAVDAILLLSKKDFFRELEFTIYGEGYLFEQLTRPLREFSNVVINNFFVENKNIPAIHKDFGIFLCPSRLDTQGVSMCEAMSSGLVPIASPIGGIPEYAQREISSFQESTAEGIAQRIEYLYYNPDVFLKMSGNARKAIENRCAISKTITAEMTLISSVLSEKSKTSSVYQQCTQCILDSNDDPNITFDGQGICSFCRSYAAHEHEFVKTGPEGQRELERIVAQIKKAGAGEKYDCIIGLSGGVDSTYLALKAKELGLRPLAVHFDNGWNSELAVNNIENIVTRLGFDLHTHVIDWEEFRDLQIAFLKASVVDIEMITDHAIFASLYQIAIENKIKYILSGVNYVTESVLPPSWIHDKRDHIHIRAINKQFGTRPLKNFPLFTSALKISGAWHGIQSVGLLNYFPYIKADVKKTITDQLQWRDYGGKHYESIFTRFYQGYILPVKFGIDKRKAHLSNLICSGQIKRAEALAELEKPAYPEQLKATDYEFVLKKFDFTNTEFEAIMKQPVKQHADYPVDVDIYKRFSNIAPLFTILENHQTG